MRGVVHIAAAAGLGPIVPPARRNVGATAGEVGPHRRHLPNRTLRQQLLDLAVPRVEALVETHHEADTGALAGSTHLLALARAECHGLLAEDVLALRCRGQRVRQVAPYRRGDVDDLHVRVGNDVLDASVDSWHIMPAGERRGSRSVAAHDRHQLRVWRRAHGWGHHPFGDVAGADDPPANDWCCAGHRPFSPPSGPRLAEHCAR